MAALSSIIPVFMPKTETGLCLFYSFHMATSVVELAVNSVFIVLNWMFLIVSVVFTGVLISKLQKSSKRVKSHGRSKGGSSQSKRYMKILLLMISNLTCWIPLQILMMVSMSGLDVNPHVSNWLVVLLLPFNSLANPFLYIISTIWKTK